MAFQVISSARKVVGLSAAERRFCNSRKCTPNYVKWPLSNSLTMAQQAPLVQVYRISGSEKSERQGFAALPLQSMVTCSDLPSRKDPWSCWCSDADGIFWESSPLSWHKKATNTTVLPWASVKIASGPCQSIFSVLTLLEHVGSVSQDSRSAPPGHWESLQRHMLARQARPLCYHVSYSWTSWLSEALRCKLMSDVKHLQRSQNLRITWSVHQWAAIWESII